MAQIVALAVDVDLGGTDYSSQISQAALRIDVDLQDGTTFGNTGWRSRVGGLKDGNLDLTFKKDSDLSTLDAYLFGALGTSIAYILQIDGDSATSTTNPTWSGNCTVSGYEVGAEIGQLFGGSFSFPLDGAVTRATS